MRTFPFVTVDVFTDRRFGGNQLAVFPDARGLSDAEMQALAAEFNLSETTFVLPPENPAHTARVRIFTRQYEMPFAGHPNVGTGFVLAQRGGADRLVFEEIAGLVEILVERDASGEVVGATIAAPQPLSLGERFPAAAIAACAGLEEAAIRTTAHPPVHAGTGNPFILAEVEPEALSRAQPDFAAFRRLVEAHPGLKGRAALHLYAHAGPGAVRARVFAPLGGTVEDAATGSAATPLAALLLSLSPGRRRRGWTSPRASRWAARACCGRGRTARRMASAPASAGVACPCCGARPCSKPRECLTWTGLEGPCGPCPPGPCPPRC